MSLDVAEARRLLEARREALVDEGESSRDSREAVELDPTRMGRLSRMDAMQQQEMARAEQARRERELQRIAAALRRVQDGSWDECVACGEAIAEPRLRLDPAATLCIACAEQRERG